MFRKFEQSGQNSFDEQLYLTLYEDIYLSCSNPKAHYSSFGKFENRTSNLHELMNNKIFYSIAHNGVIEELTSVPPKSNQLLISIPWRPKRIEWGWIITGTLDKNFIEHNFLFDLATSDILDIKELNINAKVLSALEKSKINFSKNKQKFYLFFNLGV